MEKIYFDNLDDLEKIKSALFVSNDPSSYYYKRKLNRPSVPWKKVFLWLLGFLVITLISVRFAPFGYFLKIFFPIVYLALTAKPACTTLIRIYQHYAPDYIRNRCRFEPSCSEYMLQAIDKYGLCKGVYKGINRLWRCNHGDGGYDYP